MSVCSIIVAAYSVVAICITIVLFIRRNRSTTPFDKLMDRKQRPIWLILLLLPIYPIALVFYGLIQLFDPAERKKRATHKHLKTDKDFRKEYAKLETDKIDVTEGVEDTQERVAAICLGKALLREELSPFSALLDEDAEQTIYAEKRFELIKGNAAIRKYWHDWIVRQKEQGLTHKFKIIRAEYFSTEALAIDYYDSSKRYCTEYLVVFHFNAQGKIQRIIFTSSRIYYTYFVEGKKDLLVTLETLSPKGLDRDFDTDSHLPCIYCGKPSSQLLWFGYRRIAYAGEVSFCPDCKEIVEHYCHTHIYVDYHNEYFPINDNIEYIEKKIVEGYCASSYAYYDKPIGWQRNIYFYDDSVLDLGQPADWSEEKKLQYAIEKGEYEAYNNLALQYVDEDDDKALEYFKLAVENDILSGILNLSLWYYKHNDLPNFIEYTRLAAEDMDVIAMYNLAFAQFSNEFDIQDTDSAIKQYKKTIEECDRIKFDRIMNKEENEIAEEWDNTVLQRSYYDLAVIYYRKGEFNDLLLSYAYLNQCPHQIEMIKDMKTEIYSKLLDRHTEYDDLPF